MASLTVTLVDQCKGGTGAHLTFSVSGDRSAQIATDVPSMSEPITADEAEAFVKIIVRMARSGKTLNQWRTALQNGITVTV